MMLFFFFVLVCAVMYDGLLRRFVMAFSRYDSDIGLQLPLVHINTLSGFWYLMNAGHFVPIPRSPPSREHRQALFAQFPGADSCLTTAILREVLEC